jgi:catalase-peroxidase
MTRDMGPRTRCLGKWAPPAQPWQMPLPDPPKTLPDFGAVKADVLSAIGSQSPAATPDTVDGKATYGPLLATLAYQCASTFRRTDFAGGCNGARIRFAPQKDWPSNRGLDKVLGVLAPIKDKYPNLSWADLIVLAGTAANEAAGGGPTPFCGGRTDAADGAGVAALAPRQYVNASVAVRDNAKVAGLTPEEAVALAGRLRSAEHQKRLGYSGTWAGASGDAKLSNAYFKALLGENWQASKSAAGQAEFKAAGKPLYMTPEDLAIKADPQLAAIAKAYADDNAKFVAAFGGAWAKLMNADRFKGPAGSVCGGAEGRATSAPA